MRPRNTKWLRLILPGCVLLQLSACVGDPHYFLATIAAQWVTSSIVSTLVNLLPSI
jgi:hypothetical protein